jgi:hypothetical protein
MPVRWNSTYLMLNSLIRDKVPFTAFINQHCPYKDQTGGDYLSADTWHIAESMVQFLETFYDSTVALSGVYYPTSPTYVHDIFEMAQHLKRYKNDPIYLKVAFALDPFLYAFAFILDHFSYCSLPIKL